MSTLQDSTDKTPDLAAKIDRLCELTETVIAQQAVLIDATRLIQALPSGPPAPAVPQGPRLVWSA